MEPSVAVLIDNSGSIPAEFSGRIHEAVTDRSRSWVLQGQPGDNLSLWFFAPGNSPFPAYKRTWKLPTWKAPANRHRKVVAGEILAEIRDALLEMPAGTNQTPLLESIHYVAATKSAGWELVLFSDLHQDSGRWKRLRPSKGADPSESITGMLELCPPVQVPPERIRVFAWPGFVGRSIDVEQYEHDRAVFAEFFSRWAPTATVEFIHFQ